jgi:hypothetical protein
MCVPADSNSSGPSSAASQIPHLDIMTADENTFETVGSPTNGEWFALEISILDLDFHFQGTGLILTQRTISVHINALISYAQAHLNDESQYNIELRQKY